MQVTNPHAYEWAKGFERLQRRFRCLDTELDPAMLAGKPVRGAAYCCHALSDGDHKLARRVLNSA